MTPQRILSAVADAFAVTPEALLSPWRVASVAEARHAAAWLLRRLTRLSYPEIGRLLGRHHATVMAGERAFAAKRERAAERLTRACELLGVPVPE
jgi:chromosomal replication initiation ATPase DnaA